MREEMRYEDKVRRDIIHFFGKKNGYSNDLPLIVSLTDLFNTTPSYTLTIYTQVLKGLIREGFIESHPSDENKYRLTTLV